MKGINLATYFENSALAHPTKTALIFEEQGQWTMNYPAASHGVSKARQQHENHLEASFGVWTRGAIKHIRIQSIFLRNRSGVAGSPCCFCCMCCRGT